MKVLAIDTTTPYLFLTLVGGKDLLFNLVVKGVKHGEVLAESIRLVDLKEVDLVVSGLGPGSFTGTRIGLSFALGLSFGLKVPLVGVSSLKAKAHAFWEEGIVVSAVDGRREEIFFGVYEKKGEEVEVLVPESRVKYKDFPKVAQGKMVILDGRDSFLKEMRSRGISFKTLQDVQGFGKSLCILGEERFKEKGDEKLSVKPIYLRASDPEERLKLPL